MRWDVDLKSCLLLDGDEDMGSAMRGVSKAGAREFFIFFKKILLVYMRYACVFTCVSRLRRCEYVTVCTRRSEDLLRCPSSLSNLFFSQGLSCFVPCDVYSRQAGLQPL